MSITDDIEVAKAIFSRAINRSITNDDLGEIEVEGVAVEITQVFGADRQAMQFRFHVPAIQRRHIVGVFMGGGASPEWIAIEAARGARNWIEHMADKHASGKKIISGEAA